LRRAARLSLKMYASLVPSLTCRTLQCKSVSASVFWGRIFGFRHVHTVIIGHYLPPLHILWVRDSMRCTSSPRLGTLQVTQRSSVLPLALHFPPQRSVFHYLLFVSRLSFLLHFVGNVHSSHYSSFFSPKSLPLSRSACKLRTSTVMVNVTRP
jgi:hypothetical protein